MRRNKRNRAAGFKAKVALAAVKGDKTVAELAKQFEERWPRLAGQKSESDK